MKKILLFGSMALLIALGSCGEKDPVVTPEARGGTLRIHVKHQVNGKDAQSDAFLYMNEAGDSFQVTLLQHYLSNFEFHSPETGWQKKAVYKLVRMKDPTTLSFDITDMPFGNYDSIRFYTGIDSVTNHNIDKVGELDPGYGMIWTWNSGYIFYMFEGKFVNDNDVVLPFAYHIGGDEYLMEYELPIAETKSLSTGNTLATIDLVLEMDEIFKNPNLIDLNQEKLVSHTFDEPALSKKLRDNLLNAFKAE